MNANPNTMHVTHITMMLRIATGPASVMKFRPWLASLRNTNHTTRPTRSLNAPRPAGWNSVSNRSCAATPIRNTPSTIHQKAIPVRIALPKVCCLPRGRDQRIEEQSMRNLKSALIALAASCFLLIPAYGQAAKGISGCEKVPDYGKLKAALQAAVKEGKVANSG